MEEKLKRAIAAGDFTAARELLPAYIGRLEAECRRLPAGGEEFRRLAGGAEAFLRWARAAVLCGRAQCAARLEQAGRVSGYQQPARGRGRGSWEMRG